MSYAPPTRPTPDFASLAGRISTWTTRGLLSAMVLAAGLGLGRQILHWWMAPTATAGLPSAVATVADADADCSIHFGQSPWAVSRKTLTGDKQHAIKALRTFCREKLVTSAEKCPLAVVNDSPALIKQLSRTKPVDWQPGRWRLYEMSDELPMAVGLVREVNQDNQNPAATDETARLDLAQGGYRVVIWALAAPSAENQWTLMVFQPDAENHGELGNSPSAALPPGCQRTLALRTADGWEVVGFHGTANPEDIKSFFDRQTSGGGAKPVGGWQPRGNAWHAKYIGNDNRAMEVRFGPDPRGEQSGIVMIYPSPPSP
jgi:hypothetical protein